MGNNNIKDTAVKLASNVKINIPNSNNVITTQDLINEASDIKNNGVNKGRAFLKGKATSAFAQTCLTELKNAGLSTMDIQKQKELAKKLSSLFVNKIKAEAKNSATAYINIIKNFVIKEFPTYIVDRTTYWTMEYTEDPGYLINSIINEGDDEYNDNKEKTKNKKTNDTIEKISYYTYKINNAINVAIEYSNTYSSMLVSYITEGPSWVTKKMNELSREVISNLYKYENNAINDAKKIMLENGDQIAEGIGYDNAEKINSETEKAFKKQYIKSQEKNTKTNQKVKALKAKAALKLKALLGA